MIEIEIDGKKLEVEPGSMIIEAADAAGINIPRFCYHKKLTVAANCRMCLVEVEKVGKPLPACATPVTAGMKILTQSAKAIDAQKAVMEFLLINHPLDCPICDQGGECELQDLSMGYGKDISQYSEGKRTIKDKNLGPLIATDMTRCIQCSRCVRFGAEIAGMRELGMVGRGEKEEITTYIEKSLVSELSGNIIDLCPVGALTSKPFRFQARAWELIQTEAIAPHDCIGSNIYIHKRRNEVLRVVPNENEAINETWISDRDRFSYTGLNNSDRLTTPMIKRGGRWEEVDWMSALDFTITKLNDFLHDKGGKQLAALASPSSTTEEFYLFQKLMRALGCHNIDHRLHQTELTDQNNTALYPGLTCKIEDIQQQEIILLIGSNIQKDQPLAGHRVRKANLSGAKILAVNCIDYVFNFTVDNKMIVAPNELTTALAEISQALIQLVPEKAPKNIPTFLSQSNVSDNANTIAKSLLTGERKLILLGAVAHNHPQASVIRGLAELIAVISNAKCAYLTEGGNAAGAWIAGAIPHREAAGVSDHLMGMNFAAAIDAKLKAYFLLNVEPEYDCINPAQTINTMAEADLIVALTCNKSPALLQHADVLLPACPFTQTDGTYINAEGRWQSFQAAVTSKDSARPAWKILRVLANLLNVPGFEYVTASEISAELKSLLDQHQQEIDKINTTVDFSKLQLNSQNNAGIQLIAEWPMYRIDSLVRHAIPLQESGANISPAIYINTQLAAKHGLTEQQTVAIKQNDVVIKLPVIIDKNISNNCAFIPAGFLETSGLNHSFGTIEIGAAHA